MSKEFKKNTFYVPDEAIEDLEDLNAMPLVSDIEIVEETRRQFDASERLARTHEQLNAFLKIAQAVGSSESTDSVLALICNQTSQLMRAERTSIFILDESNGKTFLTSKVSQGKFQFRLALGQGIAGTVAKRRQSLNIKDVYKSQLFDPRFDRETSFRTRSCLCAPIIDNRNDLLGVVEVINKINGYFTVDDEDFLASICSQIAVNLNQQRSYMKMLEKKFEAQEAHDALNKRKEELDLLYTLERDAASASNLEELISGMLSKLLHTFRATFVGIFFNEGSSKRLHSLKTVSGELFFEQKNIEYLPKFISEAMQDKQCQQLNAKTHPSDIRKSRELLGISLNHLLVVGLCTTESCFGALVLGSAVVDRSRGKSVSDKLLFEPFNVKLAIIFSNHLAPSIAAHLDRQAREKAQRLTAIGQMMSSLLHDMKTPLAIISGYAEMMVVQAEDQKRQVYADTIDKQIEALKAMSAEILLFARGEIQLILRKVQISKIIREAIEWLLPEAKRRRIELVSDVSFHGQIECDERKIQRVIINLAKNAMEAIGQDGKIIISSYVNASQVYLVVADDGPGIANEEGDTIFDAFVTFGKKDGTGLGLSIVKKIVDEHKATISYQSVEPKGTAFTIVFPLLPST